jgi:hydroxypyruvate reductase
VRDARDFLLGLFAAGLAAVNGRERMRTALAGRDDLDDVWLLAVGKAASAMTLGAFDALGARVTRALVVSRAGYFDDELARRPQVFCMTGGHPVPDEGSLAAGTAALEMARQAGGRQRVLLLVSGGASSLMEVLPASVSLSDLQRVSTWALASGLPIDRVNAVRRRLSRIKDGRLMAAFGHCDAEGFFISDVPGDAAALVGSGLLAAATGIASEAGLPAWVCELMAGSANSRPTPPRAAPACVGCLEDALAAIRQAALAAGLRCQVSPDRLEGDAMAAAGRLGGEIGKDPPELVIYGGETTVQLPPSPGRGGRNQHLALAAARLIAGRDDLTLLAAGTDGSDGNSDDAGAIVDGGTIERGRDAGLDPDVCLASADSGRFLEASGDLVHTGVTGTNVGDLLLTLCCDPGRGLLSVPSM